MTAAYTTRRARTVSGARVWRSLHDGTDLGTPTPPQPTGPTMLLGTTERGIARNLDTKLTAINPNAKIQIRRSYDDTWTASFAACKGNADIGKWATWISFSLPSILTIKNGGADGTLASYFGSIPAGHRVMTTYLHEPEGKIPVGTTRADYAAAHARIWDIKQANSPAPANHLTGIILTAQPYRDGTYTQYYPTNGKFDFVGADPYRFWRDVNDPNYAPDLDKSGGSGVPRTMQYLLGDLPSFAAANDKFVAIGEYGAHPTQADPTNRPAWLQETDDYLRSLGRCIAAIYFDSPLGKSGPWILDKFHVYTDMNDQENPLRWSGPDDPSSMNKFAAILAAHQ